MCVIFNQNTDSLTNTKWICTVSNSCIDTLTFIKNNRANNYSCELNYTSKGHYKRFKNIVVLTEKDDSHDEDGGKTVFFRTKFILKENNLFPISSEELVNGKWKEAKMQKNKDYVFRKIAK